jgi:hypothetical protein
MSAIAPLPLVGLPPVPIRRFTVDEYHSLLAAQILADGEQAELLEGWIIPRQPSSPPHATCSGLAADAIRRRLPPGWSDRLRSALTTADSEAEPDLALVLGGPRDYLQRHPGPQVTGLVVEVADSTWAGFCVPNHFF